MNVDIERWIDVDGPDFQRLDKPILLRKIVTVGIEEGFYKVDNVGYMWQSKDPSEPVYAELDGKLVGLRFSAKAKN